MKTMPDIDDDDDQSGLIWLVVRFGRALDQALVAIMPFAAGVGLATIFVIGTCALCGVWNVLAALL